MSAPFILRPIATTLLIIAVVLLGLLGYRALPVALCFGSMMVQMLLRSNLRVTTSENLRDKAGVEPLSMLWPKTSPVPQASLRLQKRKGH